MKTKRLACLVLSCLLALTLLPACSQSGNTFEGKDKLGNGWEPESSLEVLYAQNYAVDYYRDGYTLISISDGSRFLVIPEGLDVPAGIDTSITVLQRPLDHIYLVATSAMCLFDSLDALPSICLSGTKAEDWHVDNARAAMEAGDILYAGKYSTPDYELITSSECRLAIQSTMISHSPEIQEKLQDMGIPVLVDQSSHEKHPLGRTEWIKLYAALVDKEEEAKQLFDEQIAYADAVAGQNNTGQTVAFFHISTSGHVVARRSGDYVTKMIELAGGEYVFKDLGDPETSTSTVAIEMETFYASAKDADYIIYNSTIGGEITSLDELVGMNDLLSEFKAVQNGNVWCTNNNLFQETTQLGLMISNIHEMLVSDDPALTELDFLHKLQ